MLTKACLPGMRANGFSRIINIGSIHALVGSPYKSAYVPANYGLMGMLCPALPCPALPCLALHCQCTALPCPILPGC